MKLGCMKRVLNQDVLWELTQWGSGVRRLSGNRRQPIVRGYPKMSKKKDLIVIGPTRKISSELNYIASIV
jgi:hypothetical protein